MTIRVHVREQFVSDCLDVFIINQHVADFIEREALKRE